MKLGIAVTAVVLWWVVIGCGPRVPETVSVAMEDDIISLDPHSHDDEVTSSVLANVYQGLVGFDAQMRIVPLLARSWENPNDLTWRFNLRPGVMFHDGRPMTAADAAYSLERARSGKMGHYLALVNAVRAPDDLTVEIVTSQPAPVLLNKLSFIAIVPGDAGDSITSPVGTGPYRFEEYRPGRHLMLRAFEGYWGGRPSVARACFRVIPTPQERMEALTRGEVQLTKFVLLGDSVGRGSGGIRFASLPGLGVTLLGANVELPGPLRDRRVRQAIFWAIDPRSVIEENKLDAKPTGQLVPPFVVGFMPEREVERPRLELARKLLAQAGHRNGLRLSIEVSSSALERGRSIAGQLARAGIELEVVPREWPDLNQRLNSGGCPFFLVGWSCISGDASDLLDACIHSREGESYGSANWSGYRNRELDALIERSDRMLDARQRIELLHRALGGAMDDMPLIPLYVRNQTYGYHGSLDFIPRQDGMVLISEISIRRRMP